jgi:hypothetical protein
MQKFPAEEFTATAKLSFMPRNEIEKVGLIIFGLDYASLSLVNTKDELKIIYSVCRNADKGEKEEIIAGDKISQLSYVYLRVSVSKGGNCKFSYSTDGIGYKEMKNEFTAKPGKWVGAKIGLYCTRNVKTNDGGYADIDWFRISK